MSPPVRLFPVTLCAVLAACATIDRGSTATISLVTSPPGAACTVTRGQAVVATVASTPGSFVIERRRGALSITCTKPGYDPASTTEEPLASKEIFTPTGGLLLSIASTVDDASGANYRFRPQIDLALHRPGEPITQAPLSLDHLRLR